MPTPPRRYNGPVVTISDAIRSLAIDPEQAVITSDSESKQSISAKRGRPRSPRADGEKFRRLRGDLTQEEMEQVTGVPVITIQRVERGDRVSSRIQVQIECRVAEARRSDPDLSIRRRLGGS
jgi:hypothetical protein